VKGAFTGAGRDHSGYFKQADGGTLFLDEVGELTLPLQVKLLRALQEKKFTPLGSTQEIGSNFRLISATHQSLMQQVVEGKFREDLFYRLAIGVIKIPPLRERREDVPQLVESFMLEINDELADYPSYQNKRIDKSVVNLIKDRAWRGNVRELRATLVRAAIWSEHTVVTVKEMEEAILSLPQKQQEHLPTEIEEQIDLKSKTEALEKRYIELALKKTGGNKTKAAALLGINSQQVISTRIEKLGIN
jgi:transcriptional regulator with PAS, ATPase and Fis domain